MTLNIVDDPVSNIVEEDAKADHALCCGSGSERGSKGTMESALLSTTWLRLGGWHQSEKQDSCSQTEEDRVTVSYSMEVKGC